MAGRQFKLMLLASESRVFVEKIRKEEPMKEKKVAAVILVAVALIALGWVVMQQKEDGSSASTIKVGILHSLTGTMAISERPVVDATLMAIEKINEEGGLLGRQIEAVIADGRSDGAVFAAEAARLIREEKVEVVFGCWTSASRKAVRPVFEANDHLLFYPVQYEGIEESPNIVYTGAAPNQQILPAVKWCLDHVGNRFFLVGSDYVFPRAANAIIKDHLNALGGAVVGEEYILLGSSEVGESVQRIAAQKPDIVLNTINGGSNVAFFRELRAAEITPDKIPTMSFSIAENELLEMGTDQMAGDYAAWNYFQSIDSEENMAFVSRFKSRYGADRVTSDPMEAAYLGVHLWAQAAADAGSADVAEVLRAVVKQSLLAPGGIVSVDQRNLHTWKTVRIGKIRPDGQFDIVWSSGQPIAPAPFPVSRSRPEWQIFLEQLYVMWGEQWTNPGIPKEIVEAAATRAMVQLEQILADNPDIATMAENSTSADHSLNLEEIQLLDNEWRDNGNDNPEIKVFLTNEVAKILKSVQKQHPAFSEIFVTDSVGLVIGMTNRTSDYYQADEGWWMEAFDSGKGMNYVGVIEYDASARIWGIALCIPVRNPTGKTVGVLKAFLSIHNLLAAG